MLTSEKTTFKEGIRLDIVFKQIQLHKKFLKILPLDHTRK